MDMCPVPLVLVDMQNDYPCFVSTITLFFLWDFNLLTSVRFSKQSQAVLATGLVQLSHVPSLYML